MNTLELMAVSLYGIYSLVAFISGWRECKKKNTFGIAPTYYLLGAFVWGDALVFGLFWTVVSAIIILVQDWLLFLLLVGTQHRGNNILAVAAVYNYSQISY